MLQELSGVRELPLIKAKNFERLKVRAVLGSILLFVVGGVVGNRSDAAFLQSWNAIVGSIMGNFWPWTIAGGAMLFSIGMLYHIIHVR